LALFSASEKQKGFTIKQSILKVLSQEITVVFENNIEIIIRKSSPKLRSS